MKFMRSSLLASLILSLFFVASPVLPGAHADLSSVNAILHRTTVGQEHVLLVINVDIVDVTDTLYVHNSQVFAVVNNSSVAVVLDFDHAKVYSPSGAQIGYITTD